MDKNRDHERNLFLNKLVSLCDSYDMPYYIPDDEFIVEIGT